MTDITLEYVHQSNLIEGFDDPSMDSCGLVAFDWLRGVHAGDGLRLNDLRFLHRVVVARQPDPLWTRAQVDWRGNLRNMNLSVGGRVCPDWEAVPGLLDDWLVKMVRWRELDPREMHVEYEMIHPWADGNGRTGRLLMWWHEVSLGREPTLIRYEEREAYYAWFP